MQEKNNANLKEQMQQQESLLYAARIGNSERVKQLLDQGVDVNAEMVSVGWRHNVKYKLSEPFVWETPLFAAVKGSHQKVVEQLLQQPKVATDWQNAEHNDNTALHEAVYNESVEIVKLLIEKGASIYVENTYRNTVLSVAAACDKQELMGQILAKGDYKKLIDKPPSEWKGHLNKCQSSGRFN